MVEQEESRVTNAPLYETIWVVIPAYNEGKTLAEILIKVKGKGLKTLVVDDGSTDETLAIAENLADRVIKNPVNMGKGRSLFLGFETLLKEDGWDTVITMDGDGQHSPDDLDKLIMLSLGNEVVVGNRLHNPNGMPLLRVLTNKVMSSFISRIINQRIADTQCGFRLIKRTVLSRLELTAYNYEVETELLIKAAFEGVKIVTTDIQCIYHEKGTSNIHPVWDTLRFFKFIFMLKKQKRIL